MLRKMLLDVKLLGSHIKKKKKPWIQYDQVTDASVIKHNKEAEESFSLGVFHECKHNFDLIAYNSRPQTSHLYVDNLVL